VSKKQAAATPTPAPAESAPEQEPSSAPKNPLPDLNLPPAVQQLLDDLLGGKPLPDVVPDTGDLGLQNGAELLDFLLGA
jgi:hypothetical protein